MCIRDSNTAAGSDDQKRTVDVEDAFRAGADFIVMGRPIRNAANPRAAAEDVQRRILDCTKPEL